MRCVHRLRKLRFHSSSFRLCMLSLLTGPAESSRGALRHPGFGLSASSQWFHPRRLPSRLTSRSSRRRVVASLKLPGMRAILAPIRRVRRGLTPALGGSRTFVFSRDLLAQPLRSFFALLPSLAATFVVSSNHAMLRIDRLARSRFASVAFTRFGNSGWCDQCSATDTVTSETPG